MYIGTTGDYREVAILNHPSHPRYSSSDDPGYTSPFISRMPGIPDSMEDDREPEYEYKDKLDKDDDIWEWEKCEDEDDDIWVEYGDGWHSEKAFMDPDADADFPDDYHKEWRDDDDDGDKPEPNDDGTWDLVLWMAGMLGVILILYGLLS